jgi:deazaflavin-dependent oxidoreductase (nitroreductase family)
MDYQAFNESVIDDFRANAGKLSGDLAELPVVLVTMRGARSGREICKPLLHTRDGDDVVVIASNGGAARHPAWYHNLVANPVVTVELGADRWRATAVLTEGDDRRRLFDQLASTPQMSEYADRVKDVRREIPIFRLVRS